MKKILSSILIGVLAIALLCPLSVFADEIDEPEESEEFCEDFTVGYYSDDLPLWERWGYDTAEELIRLWSRWGGLDLFTDQPLWVAFGDSTKEEFMEWFEIDEEEYQALEDAWARVRAEAVNRKDEEIRELGGTPGIINIMYNGRFIAFSDAVPKIIDGATFIPAAPLFSAMGAEVSYDLTEESLTAAFVSKTVSIAAGLDTMLITDDGKEREFLFGVEPFVYAGVLFISARETALALGLDIYWDGNNRSVVFVDKAGLISEIDKDFTIINSLSGIGAGLGAGEGAQKTIVDLLISIIQFDSLDGDTTVGASAGISVISDGGNFTLLLNADLSGLMRYLADMLFAGLYDPYDYMYYMYDYYDDDYYDDDYYDDYYDYSLEDELAMIEEIIAALGMLSLEIIYNHDEGTLYIKTPLLEAFGLDIPENAWIAIAGMGDFMSGDILNEIIGELTLGELAGGASMGASICEGYSYYLYRNQMYLYDDFLRTAEYNKALYGDDMFVKTDDGYLLVNTREDLYKAAKEHGMYVNYYEYELKIAVRTDGGDIIGVTGEIITRERYYYSDTRYTYIFEISPAGTFLSVEIHEKNEMVFRIEVAVTTEATDDIVPASPPEGEPVVPIDELFPFGDYDYDYLEQVSYTT